MRLNVTVVDTNGYDDEYSASWVAGAAAVVAPISRALAGYSIEARVRDDEGELVGVWRAVNVLPAKAVTAFQTCTGTAVTDDAGNTYTEAGEFAAPPYDGHNFEEPAED
jgi:hypothetical protein